MFFIKLLFFTKILAILKINTINQYFNLTAFNMSDKKRKTYTLQFKLDTVNYAQNTSNSKAAEHYGVHISLINRWKNRKNSMEWKENKEGKVVKRIRQMCWPELELNLKEWIMEQRREGFIVSGSSILREARAQAVRMKINNFKGSAFWIFSFIKQNKFAMRSVSSIG